MSRRYILRRNGCCSFSRSWLCLSKKKEHDDANEEEDEEDEGQEKRLRVRRKQRGTCDDMTEKA